MRKKSYIAYAALGMLAAACCCPQDCSNDCIVDTKYVHQYGVTVPRQHWEEAGQNGQVISTLKDGIICTQSYYAGVLEGDTTYTFPFSSNIEKVQTYSQDQLVRETTYYTNGNPRREIVHNVPENMTVLKEWNENGTQKSLEKWAGSLLSHAEYYDNNQQMLSSVDNGAGIRTLRDNYGMLVWTDHFKDGQIEFRTTYYPNGSPQEITPYKNGVVDGLRKTYYPAGEPKTIETWYGGKQQGITTVFVDGQRSQEIPYVDGVKTGKGRIYKDGDIVVQEVTWKDDKLHGQCTTFIDGRKAVEWYYKGNKVTKGYYDSFSLRPTPVDNG